MTESLTMELEAILQGLDIKDESGGLPRQAMEAAVFRQAEVSPHLLEWLRQARDQPEALFDSWLRTTFAMYLLAQFQEPTAFPLLLDLMKLPEEHRETLWGDALCEDGPSLLISTYNGDWETLVRLADDPEVYEFSRTVFCEAMNGLWLKGLVPREQLLSVWGDFLRRWPQDPCNQVPLSFLVCCAVDAQAVELREEVETAISSGVFDSTLLRPEEVRTWLAEPDPEWLAIHRKQLKPISDAIAVLEHWGMFETSEQRQEKEARSLEMMNALFSKQVLKPPGPVKSGPSKSKMGKLKKNRRK